MNNLPNRPNWGFIPLSNILISAFFSPETISRVANNASFNMGFLEFGNWRGDRSQTQHNSNRNIRNLPPPIIMNVSRTLIQQIGLNRTEVSRGLKQSEINKIPLFKFKLEAKSKKVKKSKRLVKSSVPTSITPSECNDLTCSICIDDYKARENLRKLKCSHLFHKRCIDKWLKKQSNCPLCKCSQ